MFLKLPARPNLEHLKTQAKDLLNAHRCGDPGALGRIRAALPSYAHLSIDAIAKSGFALHDAQSAIAREYGMASWSELRCRVHAALIDQCASEITQAQSLDVPDMHPNLRADLIAEARARRVALLSSPVHTPEVLPALPLRNALVCPGIDATVHTSRPSSLRSIQAAAVSDPPLLGVFAQRVFETESPTREELYDVGCLCRVLAFRPLDSGSAWLVMEGLRWVALESLEATEPYYVARAADLEPKLEQSDTAEVARLDQKLREAARRLARVALPSDACQQALTLIDSTDDPLHLSDLVFANLTCSAAEQAAYAGQTDPVWRLRRVIELVERELPVSA